MRFRSLLLFALASPLLATQYYYSDTFSSVGSSWHQNGSVTTGSGLGSSSAGSLISTVAVPGPVPNSYEVKLTLGIQSAGASYVAYLRATQDALLTATAATGTFYAVQVTPNNGSCAYSLFKSVGGVVSSLGGGSTGACVNGTVIRVVPYSTTTSCCL